jgi:hypothetical protein
LGILLSVVMLVGGAAMTLTGRSPSQGVDPHSAGLVLMGVGLIWLVVSAAIWDVGREDGDDELAGQRIIYTRGARTAPPVGDRRLRG